MNQHTNAGDSGKRTKPLSEKSHVIIRTTLITVIGSVLVAGFTTFGTIYATRSTVAQATEGASKAKASVEDLKNRVAEATAQQDSIAVPAGTIIAYAGPIADEADLERKGWLPCDGRAVSRKEYRNLWEAIKRAWGEGDGGTTFQLPDLRGVFLRGVNSGRTGDFADPDASSRTNLARGGSTGNNVGSYQSDNTQAHSHQWGEYESDDLYSWNRQSGRVKVLDRLAGDQIPPGRGKDDDFMDVMNVAGGFWTKPEFGIRGEIRPRNAYVNYIIKY